MAWYTTPTNRTAPAATATTNPWWSPGRYTGPGGYDWGQTPYGEMASEKAPEAAWLRYGSTLGLGGGESAMDRWFRQQFGNAMTGYQAATISNPMLDINTYFSGLGDIGKWLQMFASRTTPQQRGESFGNNAAPVRWVTR